MNLRFVEAFYWVATFKSMTRAAEKLSLTQGAISSRVACLEQELGTSLIDRRDKQLRLTASGQRFLSYAERFLTMQRQLRREMGSPEQSATNLRIGAIESVLHTWLVPLLDRLREDSPQVELELTIEMTPVILEQLKRGSLDLVFAAAPLAADGVRSVALPPLEMVFVGGAHLGARRVHELQDLADQELLTFQRGSQPHVGLVDLLRSQGVKPRKLHSVSSISAMQKLLESGLGIATLPYEAARNFVTHDPRFVMLKCATPLPPLPVHASYRSGPTSTAIEVIVDDALQFVSRVTPGSVVRTKKVASAPARRRKTQGGHQNS